MAAFSATQRRLGLLVGILVACQGPAGAVTSSTSGTTHEEEASTGPLLTTSSGSAGSDAGSASSAMTTTTTTEGSTEDPASTGASSGGEETGGESSTTGVEPASCKKLDLLFMIIDHGALWDTTWAIRAMMPHVAERLTSEFEGWDYHVLLANPDGHWGNVYCTSTCGEDPNLCDYDNPYPCGYTADACDQTLGAGVTFPAGAGASNVPCPIDGDQRYVVAGQQDLDETLSCLGLVGTGYNSNWHFPVVRATLDALSAPLNQPGACNEGFLRDDAYLILFVIAPYPDTTSEGTPEAWTAELKDHKGGKFDKIYFIGLYGGCDSGYGWKEFEPLNEWTRSLYHHQNDDACASTLIPYIDPALDYVLEDCSE